MRQAADQNNADQFSVDDIHRSVIQNTAVAWNQMQTAQSAVEAQQRQIDAARIAFEGMRKEYSNGDRSTLDVLVAEETLRDAELALVSAKHDLFVSKSAVLQNMGWLELRNLVSHPRLYRPEDNLKKVESPLTKGLADVFAHTDDPARSAIKPMKVGHSSTEPEVLNPGK